MITVEPGDPRHPDSTALLQAAHEHLNSLSYPPRSQHYLGSDSLCAPSVRFFVARRKGVAVGCGALAVRDGYGEVKSMFTTPSVRHEGTASKILHRLEDTARDKGLKFLRLETGHDMNDAIGLYRRHGFADRGPFGDYDNDPLSLFMEKRL